jgi:hypothetical protein
MPAGGIAAETRILSEGEVAFWFETAKPGDRLVYCTGPRMLPGPTMELVARLVGEKRLSTHPRRAAGDGPVESRPLEHVLQVLPPPKGQPSPPPPSDDAMEAIFDLLRRAAERRRACPSNAALARSAGLSTRYQAAWRVRKLEERRRIAIETIATPDGQWRIVTILATGKSTAARPLPSEAAA